jgi:hypothetical protein
VSPNERKQVEERVEGWVAKLLEAGADVRRLSALLKKPLRPLWISQASVIWTNCVAQPEELPFTPVMLVSASQPHQYKRMTSRAAEAAAGGEGGGSSEGGSAAGAGGGKAACGGKRKAGAPTRRQRRRRSSAGGGASSEDEGGGAAGAATWSYVYVPGAGDDEESWAGGLTPGLFWQHCEGLLSAGPGGIKAEVRRLLLRYGSAAPPATARPCAEWARERGLARRPAHALPPRGCEAVGGAAAGAGGDGAAAPLQWVGGTGMALGGAAAAGSPRIWRSVDAVLCLGKRLPLSLVPEWRAAQLLSNCGAATPQQPSAAASLLASSPAAEPIPIGPRRCAACASGGAPAGGSGSAGSPGSSEAGSSGSPGSGGPSRQGHRRGAGASFGLLAAMLRRSGGAAPPAAPSDGATGSLEAAGGPLTGGGSTPCTPSDGSGPIACAARSVAHSAGSGSSSSAASSHYSTCSEDESSGSLGSLNGSGVTCCTCQGAPGGGAQGPPRIMWLPVAPAKKDRTGLRAVMAQALAFVSAHLAEGRTVLLQDEEGGAQAPAAAGRGGEGQVAGCDRACPPPCIPPARMRASRASPHAAPSLGRHRRVCLRCDGGRPGLLLCA